MFFLWSRFADAKIATKRMQQQGAFKILCLFLQLFQGLFILFNAPLI